MCIFFLTSNPTVQAIQAPLTDTKGHDTGLTETIVDYMIKNKRVMSTVSLPTEPTGEEQSA